LFSIVTARLDGGAEAGFVAGMKYHITLVESEEGWAVWCNDLPGCCSQGDTREEAVENIRIAIKEWLEAAEDELRADPDVRNVLREEVLV
jgi:predicted RNase H-like HicB family nuclease